MKVSKGVFIGSIVVLSIIVISTIAMTGDKKGGDDVLAQAYAFTACAGDGSFLGVHLSEVDSEVVKKLGLREEYGALIKKVVEDSAAEKAGLKENDVIIRWNDARIEGVAQLKRIIQETPPGRKARIEILRGGSPMTVEATLEKPKMSSFEFDLKESLEGYQHGLKMYRDALCDVKNKICIKDKDGKLVINTLPMEGLGTALGLNMFCLGGKPRMGVMLQDLTPQLREDFGLKDDRGVLVCCVIEDSAAEKAGMKKGDVIVSIDGKEVEDASDVIGMVAEKEAGTLDVVAIRDKQEKSFKVTIEKEEKSLEKKLEPAERGIKIKMPHISKTTQI